MDELKPHRDDVTSFDAGLRVRARVKRVDEIHLELLFLIAGPIESVILPHPLEPAFTEGLWNHTCFEMFVGSRGRAPYLEYNLSPSGAWAAYSFESYRLRSSRADSFEAPSIEWVEGLGEAEMRATVALPESSVCAHEGLDVALATVIELRSGSLSYWALDHPQERPDFHDRRAFLVGLDPLPPS
jgi:hypothetical protein